MTLSTAAAARKDANTGKADMQHRHFTTVATILANLDKDALGITTGQHNDLCEAFADELAGTNYRFDRKRFLAACGF